MIRVNGRDYCPDQGKLMQAVDLCVTNSNVVKDIRFRSLSLAEQHFKCLLGNLSEAMIGYTKTHRQVNFKNGSQLNLTYIRK